MKRKFVFIMLPIIAGIVSASPETNTPLELTDQALQHLRQIDRSQLSEANAQHLSNAIEGIERLEELLMVQGHSEIENGTYNLCFSGAWPNPARSLTLRQLGRRLIVEGLSSVPSFQRDSSDDDQWTSRYENQIYVIEVIDQRTFRLVEKEHDSQGSLVREYDAFYEKVVNDEQPGQPETRTTTTGAVFTRDNSHPALGEAWRDPSGLIWGNTVMHANGSAHRMNHNEATNYCASIGARLPTKEEFTRFREYMGARSGTYEGYSAQVLPNLSGCWFWSSSVNPNSTAYAYYFNGSNGVIDYFTRHDNYAVRCVVVGR